MFFKHSRCNMTIKIHANFESMSVKLLPFTSAVSKAELPLIRTPSLKKIYLKMKIFPSSVKTVHKIHT